MCWSLPVKVYDFWQVEFCDPHGLLYFADYAPKVKVMANAESVQQCHLLQAFKKLRETIGIDENHYKVTYNR